MNDYNKKTSNTAVKTEGLREIADIFDNYMKGMDAMSAKAYKKLDDSEEKKWKKA